MKRNSNLVIIYDNNCPLCQAYTNIFVNTGFLLQHNRISFSSLGAAEYPVDWTRARHEIPVIDKQTNQVWYGIDALVRILQQKFTFLPALMKIKPLNWSIRKLYKLISYNRRLIVSNPNETSCGIDCRPTFNLKYRILFLSIILLLSFLFTNRFFEQFDINHGIIYIIPALPFLILITSVSTILKTDIISQYSLIWLISSFFMFLTAIVHNIFLPASPTIFHAGTIISLTAIIHQTIRRSLFTFRTRNDTM